MAEIIEGHLSAAGQRIAIVVSRFNSFICDRLLEGVIDTLTRHGVDKDLLTIIRVPGAFEIPLLAKKLTAQNTYDAVICLGAVIRGGTPHFDYVCAEVTKGVASVSLESGVPIAFGVLTTDSIDQAIERAGSKAGNKGVEAALTAIEMVNLFKTI